MSVLSRWNGVQCCCRKESDFALFLNFSCLTTLPNGILAQWIPRTQKRSKDSQCTSWAKGKTIIHRLVVQKNDKYACVISLAYLNQGRNQSHLSLPHRTAYPFCVCQDKRSSTTAALPAISSGVVPYLFFRWRSAPLAAKKHANAKVLSTPGWGFSKSFFTIWKFRTGQNVFQPYYKFAW